MSRNNTLRDSLSDGATSSSPQAPRTEQDLLATLQAALPLLPADFQTELARLLVPEHLVKLAQRLLKFWREGVPAEPPPPFFDAECTPPLSPCFAPLREALRLWEIAHDLQAPSLAEVVAEKLAAVGCAGLLLLLGQRLTPASLTDARAIPPTRAELLAAAEQPHRPGDPMTVVARALTKHVHRSPDTFWGVVTGTVPQKNEAARQVLLRLFDGATWWNCFGHFKHEVVYEVRVSTGHGARWGIKTREFIGFLEPFVMGGFVP